jgi:hypothetical protein
MRASVGLTLMLLSAFLAGCRHGLIGGKARGPAPTYQELAATYNARVGPLERLWSTTTVRVWYPNEEGEEEQAQVEGHLQYLRPSKFSLSFEKVGEVHGLLGSNDQKYWWIEVGKQRTAHIGEHAKVTPARVAKLGVPVHPLDLVECLGITPLPVDGAPAGVAWSNDGAALVVTIPGRMGCRRLTLNPETYEPSRIELLGGDGRPSATCDLEMYERIETPDHQGPRMATRFLMSAQDGKLRIRLTLGVPEMSASRPKEKAFDLPTLLKAYSVNQIDDLDAPGGG